MFGAVSAQEIYVFGSSDGGMTAGAFIFAGTGGSLTDFRVCAKVALTGNGELAAPVLTGYKRAESFRRGCNGMADCGVIGDYEVTGFCFCLE